MRGVSHKAVGLLFGLLYEPIRSLYALSIKLVQADSGLTPSGRTGRNTSGNYVWAVT